MLLSFLEGFLQGLLIGFQWYRKQIKMHKYMIICAILDVVLLPIKILLILIALPFKSIRKFILNYGNEIIEEEKEL